MVMTNGTTETTIIKAKYLSDIRKTSIPHNHDVALNDLILMLQRIFSIKSSQPINLKYRDSEGDFITLTDDNDILLALQTEKSLFIEISVDSDASPLLEEMQKQLSCVQSCVEKLSRSIVALASSAASKSCEQAHNEPRSPVPAPISPSVEIAPATIQPSLQQMVDPTPHVANVPAAEDEINLGGEAASEVSADYPPSSIPSFPQAQAPYSMQDHNSYQPSAPPPPQQPTQQQYPGYTQPQPTPPTFAPPQQYQAPPASYAPPPQAFGAPPTMSAPPTQYGLPPTQSTFPSQAPPTSMAPPPSMAPSMGHPPSSMPPPTQPTMAAPHHPSFPPPSVPGAYAPQGSYAPPTFPPAGYPPMAGGGPGANPFARPPTDYRQSPYHQ